MHKQVGTGDSYQQIDGRRFNTVYATNERDHGRMDHTVFSRKVEGRRMNIQSSLDSYKAFERIVSAFSEITRLSEDTHTHPIHTCRLPVVLEHLTEHQLVGLFAEGVPEHGNRGEIHVTVGAFGLKGTRSIKIPLR